VYGKCLSCVFRARWLVPTPRSRKRTDRHLIHSDQRNHAARRHYTQKIKHELRRSFYVRKSREWRRLLSGVSCQHVWFSFREFTLWPKMRISSSSVTAPVTWTMISTFLRCPLATLKWSRTKRFIRLRRTASLFPFFGTITPILAALPLFSKTRTRTPRCRCTKWPRWKTLVNCSALSRRAARGNVAGNSPVKPSTFFGPWRV